LALPALRTGLKDWACAIKRDANALYLAARDPRVPWYAKAIAACITAYALSPIDLIPDYIPVLGYLDDAIILPIAITLAVKMIPAEIMAEHRAAAAMAETRPKNTVGAVAIVATWVIISALSGWLAWRHLSE
jgi:uncharacterized membrane protein YkvA (DUF1232 family)